MIRRSPVQTADLREATLALPLTHLSHGLVVSGSIWEY